MTVDLDTESCIECCACADLCPEVFEMDDRTGKARVIVFEVTDTICIEEAITTCPAECIFRRE
ncbi:MAG: ferredoxin [Syntrophobacteraceae bacterium]|nr:ferredoxin [Syntrophobacteraceae bacterium]